MSKNTPLIEQHIEADAKIVDFAGYKMPMFYKGIVPEHKKVRESVGVFDLSHMGEFYLKGAEAGDFINKIITNDISKLKEGQCQYSCMCYDDGGIVDDLLVYKLDDDEWMLVVNASNIDKDWEWIEKHRDSEMDFVMENRSDDFGLIAVQGPKAQKVMEKLTDINLDSFSYYWNARTTVAGVEMILSRTGYTGEDGFEMYIAPEKCPDIWDKVMRAGEEFGIEPIGLGARDTLRMEMKFALYGNDIDETTNPWEARLGWVVKLEKQDFIAREKLIDLKTKGIDRRLVCFRLLERGFPRKGYPILKNGEEIGVVTSGTFSPSMDIGIGLGYVKSGEHKSGNKIDIMIRNHPTPAMIEKPPLYKEGSHK